MCRTFFRKLNVGGVFLFVVFGVVLWSVPFVQAVETAPQTKCVTTATKKLHADAVARMKKDTAAYSDNASLAPAIAQYGQVLDVAWAAMEEPYCGYGVYGMASAAKSYTKSAQRARSAFLAEVKKVRAAPQKATVAAPKTVPTPTTPAATIKAPSIPKETQKIMLRSGLFQGMRSTDVTELQKKLNAYFGASDALPTTGFFGPMTRERIIQFQIDKGIIKSSKEAGAGRFGPKTAAVLNAL